MVQVIFFAQKMSFEICSSCAGCDLASLFQSSHCTRFEVSFEKGYLLGYVFGVGTYVTTCRFCCLLCLFVTLSLLKRVYRRWGLRTYINRLKG